MSVKSNFFSSCGSNSCVFHLLCISKSFYVGLGVPQNLDFENTKKEATGQRSQRRLHLLLFARQQLANRARLLNGPHSPLIFPPSFYLSSLIHTCLAARCQFLWPNVAAASWELFFFFPLIQDAVINASMWSLHINRDLAR